ncbi:hypothetical protein BH10ACT7_BH10ACT7_03490 [soil metagenome]
MTESTAYRPELFRGRYRTISLLGRGGLSEVFRAHDEFLDRDVAVKVFTANATIDSDLTRQQDEINLVAKLNHPNLVTLLDAVIDRSDEHNPQIYYVMELVEGGSLKEHLDRTTLSPRQVAQVGYDIATALEHIHHLGIVHRDIKPANILLTKRPHMDSRLSAKLSDFGVASIGSTGPIDSDQLVTGTVAYLSPEQAMGDAVGPASDVYSLGLVLLQCFTGELAFPGPPDDSAAARLVSDAPIPDWVPQEWTRLLAAMTHRTPEQRPDSREAAFTLRELFASEIGRHRSPEMAPEMAEDSATAS